jgi:hypothetical protein
MAYNFNVDVVQSEKVVFFQGVNGGHEPPLRLEFANRYCTNPTKATATRHRPRKI